MNSNNKNGSNYKIELVARYENALAQNEQLYLDPSEICDIVNWYAVSECFEEAQAALQYGFVIHPENTILLIEQAYLFLDLAQLKEAKAVVNYLKDENSADIFILKGEIALNEGKLDKAEEIFQSIDQEDLKKFEILQNIAQIYLNMGYPDLAISWIEKGKDNFCNDEAYIAVLAECYRQTNTFIDKAIDCYNDLIDRDPYNALYWCGLANTYYKLEQYEQALEAVEFALTSDSDCGEAYHIKAHAHNQLGNTKEAIDGYKKAMENGILQEAYGLTFIGIAYNNNQQWEKAVNVFYQALDCIKEHPRMDILLTEIYSNLILIFLNMGDIEDAKQISEINCQTNPNMPLTHIIDGKVKLAQSDIEGAHNAWEKACQLSSEADIFIQIADILIEAGYIESAICYLEQASVLNPEFPKLYNKLALLCVIAKNAEKFCVYNEKLEDPVTLDDAQNYLQSINPDLIEGFNDFIIRVKEIEKSNL